jgi:hypothetical protein
MSPVNLIGVYVFGSAGRGQQDHLSDLDLLAVVRTGGGKVPEESVVSYVPPNLKSLKVSISWYGDSRLREMFRNGELFAWHLAAETIALFDPCSFLTRLGKPAEYRDCVVDVASFQQVLAGIPEQVTAHANNAIYEAGLVYVCLRNIAMAASWILCETPDFSRYSVFKLSGIESCPISVGEFDITMACRMAAQRGLEPPPSVDRAFVLDVFARLDPWIKDLHAILLRRQSSERQHKAHAL